MRTQVPWELFIKHRVVFVHEDIVVLHNSRGLHCASRIGACQGLCTAFLSTMETSNTTRIAGLMIRVAGEHTPQLCLL